MVDHPLHRHEPLLFPKLIVDPIVLVLVPCREQVRDICEAPHGVSSRVSNAGGIEHGVSKTRRGDFQIPSVVGPRRIETHRFCPSAAARTAALGLPHRLVDGPAVPSAASAALHAACTAPRAWHEADTC
eukprot:6434980-Prymnesium_polylepis.2